MVLVLPYRYAMVMEVRTTRQAAERELLDTWLKWLLAYYTLLVLLITVLIRFARALNGRTESKGMSAQEILVDCEHLFIVTDTDLDLDSLAAKFDGRLLADANRPTTDGRSVGALAGDCILIRHCFSRISGSCFEG
tara:strand:- start:553 stop:960 length:408 start_codon:yes stop_codon:yes gene_type:complete